MEKQLEKISFTKRVKSMLTVDARRMFTTPLFYIMAGVSLAIPVLILVMTSMMDGSVSIDPTTGKETVMEGFKNVWQIIGSISGGEASNQMSMDLVSMCNINLIYFMLVVIVCLFIGDDFRSGYAKNLFAVRAQKSDYIVSKTITCFVASGILIVCFFIGAILGGAISGLPFTLEGFDAGNLVCCMLTKLILTSTFVPIYVLTSVIAKQKIWLSILLSLCAGMLLFSVISIVSPLNASFLNVIFSLAGGLMLSIGLGLVSKILLEKRDIL